MLTLNWHQSHPAATDSLKKTMTANISWLHTAKFLGNTVRHNWSVLA